VRYSLIVPPNISQAIGSFGLGRNALVTLLSTLRDELEIHTDNHRAHRDTTHPDLYFFCELTVWDQGRPRGFRFTVDDARATDRLFLVAAEET
jgi:hypothetical protein